MQNNTKRGGTMSFALNIQPQTTGFNFAPATEENGPLAKYEIGETVRKVVRVMNCRYTDGQGFYIYYVEENDRWFCIKGSFPYNLILNSYYEITGTITLDKKRGTRLVTVSSCCSTLPATECGIITVLKTLHGLDTQAYKLYNCVGPDVLNLIVKDPAAVASMVPGVGIKRVLGWQQELLSRGADDKELRKLYELGLNQNQAAKLIAAHGLKICEEVRQNPYRLIGEVRGYSFTKCDKYALEAGRSVCDPLCLTEGLLYTMRSIEMKGHCTYPKEEFMEAAHRILDAALTLRTAKQLLFGQKPGSVVERTVGQ
ncbi:MAG: hypothetical protein K2O18_08345 [Oscillospiraceae bacterium]|nr:hypothetical protein [Oscillospiraceae bacterium]